jgi:ABC-type sugar transport system permease subunit
MVVPAMVITLLWRWILGGEFGALNMFLNQIGLEQLARPWLGMQETALTSMLFIGFPWIAGLPFLLYLAGLQAIPKDLYEVADIEGMNAFQRLWYLDIPLIASQRKLVITFMTIQAFQFFDQPFILTNGGPGTSTLTPALFLYQTAFDRNQFGYSASIGVVLFLFVITLTVINQRFMKDSERMD